MNGSEALLNGSSAGSGKNKKKSYLHFVLLSFAVVFAVDLFNSIGMKLLLQWLSADVVYSKTVLPAAVFYTMSVLSVVWLFLAAAITVDSFVKKKSRVIIVSLLLLYLSMAISNIIPIVVVALQYDSQTIGSLISSNIEGIVVDNVMYIIRALLVVLSAVIAGAVCGKKKSGELKALDMGILFSSIALTLLPMVIEFVWVTVPFLQGAGRNQLNSQLPTIILEYVLFVLHGIAGYAVALIYSRISRKYFGISEAKEI